ncbi:MAG: thioesterase family protein [Thermodesulfobacteriota bacterium]
MTEHPAAFFRQVAENTFEPSEATIGPWSPELQHGGPPCALLTHAFRTYPSQAPFVITKISVEFLNAVPVKPCEIKVEIVRGGKRIELLKAEYLSGGKKFLVAHAWRFSPAPGVTTPVPDIFETPPFPEAQSHTFFPGIETFPYGEALEWRFIKGGYDSRGPAAVWTRPRIPLVENRKINGLESLVLMVDYANGISAELDITKWTFVPVDLIVGVYRQPEGEWVGMDARTVMEGEGIGQTSTTLFDARGKLGRSIHSLFIRPR